MITIPGHLAIKSIHGRNGKFNVGRLATSVGEFVVKTAELDQYDEGSYEGDFQIAEICPRSYVANGRLVVEIRAILAGMTLSTIDALSRDDAHRLSPQEVDPIDEEAHTPAPVNAAKAEAKPAAKTPSKAEASHDPLVDSTPFGIAPAGEPVDARTTADDEALFGALWPLADDFKLDATVDRRLLRQQRDRLDVLGYEFDPRTQRWRLVATA